MYVSHTTMLSKKQSLRLVVQFYDYITVSTETDSRSFGLQISRFSSNLKICKPLSYILIYGDIFRSKCCFVYAKCVPESWL